MSDAVLAELLRSLADLRRFWERPDRKRRLLAELGEPVELGVLRTLAAVDVLAETGEPSIGEAAQALAVDGSTASRLVDQAVVGGYLARQPGREDRRRTRLELTAAGADLLERARALQRRRLAEITADWDPAEVAQLAHLLRRLADDSLREEPAP